MVKIVLFLNDVAGTEILVIFFVVLIFFGSKSIPNLAKTLGKGLFEFRNATNDIKNEIKKSGEKMKGDLNLNQVIKDTEKEIIKPLDQVFTDVDNAVHYQTPKNIQVTSQKSTNDEDTGVNNNGEQVGSSHHEGS